MAFKFYIDTFLVDQPMFDRDLVTKIKRDTQLGGIVRTQEVSLEWFNENAITAGEISGYVYLKSVFDAGLCNEAEIKIYDQVSGSQTNLTFTGIIKMPSLQFDEQWVSVSTKIQDNSFYSYINNNKELKVDLRATQSKNKLNLTTLLPSYSVDLFNGVTGVFGGAAIGAYYRGYRVSDVFAFIVGVITDNKVGFASTYLTTMSPEPLIFKGQSLLNPFTLFPGAQEPVFEISFQDLFDEINIQKNLNFFVDATDPDNPILRIENIEQTYTNSTNVTLDDILYLKTYVDTSRLYGQVKVGSDILADGQAAWYTLNEGMSYYGWKQEVFYPLGQCNTNIELLLINHWILSNNVINDIIVGQSDAYLDNYILIECEAIDTVLFEAIATQYTFFGQGGTYYNFGLNNFNKLQRHSDKFETSFGTFLGIGGTAFRALLGDDPSNDIVYVSVPASHPNFIPPGGITFDSEFPNETTNGGYDGSGNYDSTAFEYTVPADGDYSFHQFLNFEVENCTSIEYFEVISTITLFDSALNVKAVNSWGGQQQYSNGVNFLDHTFAFNALTTDIVRASYRIRYYPNGVGNQQNSRTLALIWNSFFEANGTPDGGVSITSGNNGIKKLFHEFEYHISETQWRAIEANPTGIQPFEKDGVIRRGWIDEISHNNWTGLTQVKLITSNLIPV